MAPPAAAAPAVASAPCATGGVGRSCAPVCRIMSLGSAAPNRGDDAGGASGSAVGVVSAPPAGVNAPVGVSDPTEYMCAYMASPARTSPPDGATECGRWPALPSMMGPSALLETLVEVRRPTTSPLSPTVCHH